MRTVTFIVSLFTGLVALAQVSAGGALYASPRLVLSGTGFENLTGCWAKIHSRDGLAGESLLIVGYTSWTRMDGDASLPNWSEKISSLEVGPEARLELFSDPYLTTRQNQISGGVIVTEVPYENGVQHVGSLRLICDPN